MTYSPKWQDADSENNKNGSQPVLDWFGQETMFHHKQTKSRAKSNLI